MIENPTAKNDPLPKETSWIKKKKVMKFGDKAVQMVPASIKTFAMSKRLFLEIFFVNLSDKIPKKSKEIMFIVNWRADNKLIPGRVAPGIDAIIESILGDKVPKTK